MTTERVIEPLSISGGFLSAFDVRSNEVRTFTVARITGVEVMDSKKKVAQND
jgi:predicted DNA-binding transcriptional regulator YafY